ncbi:MAG: hypothetical protein IKJ74_01995 [Clostridia bacterium]|nr:hypothetical protein [Clostridia bacterium]
MAWKKNGFSLAAWLYELGGLIRFAPESSFSTSEPASEREGGRLNNLLLPYKKKVKSALAKGAEQSAILTLLRRFLHSLFTLRVRSFGIFFFSCGFLQLVSYFAASFLPGYEPREANLLFGVAQLFLTLICAFARGDVSDVLRRSFLFRRILRPLFGIHEWQIADGKSRDFHGGMLVIGVLMGGLSLFVSPIRIMCFLLILALVLLIFYFPEAGVIGCAMGATFLSQRALWVLIVLTLMAFLFKCAVGKRSLVFSLMDPVALLFFLPFLSLRSEEMVPGFFSLFFLLLLVSDLIRTLSGLKSLLAAVTATVRILALFLVMRCGIELLFPSVFLQFQGLKAFFFVKPDAPVGILFAMTISLILGEMRAAEKGKGWHFLGLLVQGAALFFVENSAIWLAAVLGIVIWILFAYRAGLLLLCMTGLASITALRLLPVKISAWILGLFGVKRSGVHSGGDVQSLLQFFREEGGIWLILFFALLGVFIYETVCFCTRTTKGEIHPLVLGVLCSVITFFICSVQHLPAGHNSFALFTVLLALPAAAKRAARREEVRLPY